MLKVMVVGTHRGTVDLMQRRIGGILKDIAQVETCWYDDVDRTDADIYLCYSNGVRLDALQKRFKNTDKEVVGVQFTLLPVGVRTLKSLPPRSKLGVFAEHLQCANSFLGDIITSGVVDYRFVAAPLSEMRDADVDYYVVPEELDDQVRAEDYSVRLLYVPRIVTASCAANIINLAMMRK